MGITGIKELYHIYDEVQLMPTANKPDHDDTDVEKALKRKTEDGSGFDSEDELPESDFEGFDEDDVENNHDGDNEPAVDSDEDETEDDK